MSAYIFVGDTELRSWDQGTVTVSPMTSPAFDILIPSTVGPRGLPGVVVLNSGEVVPPVGTPAGTIGYRRI